MSLLNYVQQSSSKLAAEGVTGTTRMEVTDKGVAEHDGEGDDDDDDDDAILLQCVDEISPDAHWPSPSSWN